MEALGDDEFISIFDKLPTHKDKKSFSRVSKQFLKVACIRLHSLLVSFPDLLNDILPASPVNLHSFSCSKPLSNTHMKLLAQSCPKLRCLWLSSAQNLDPQGDYESDFDDDGLCAVANACIHVYEVDLSMRLRIGDVGVISVVRSCKNLNHLDLSRCLNVTDKSLKAIGEGATQLGSLYLLGCRLITDLGLEYLANGDLKNCLWSLVLAECDKISDNSIFYLQQMNRLVYLDLTNCGVNVTQSEIPNLEILELSD